MWLAGDEAEIKHKRQRDLLQIRLHVAISEQSSTQRQGFSRIPKRNRLDRPYPKGPVSEGELSSVCAVHCSEIATTLGGYWGMTCIP